MYAMLGEVRFELLNSFTDFEETHAADFAEHEVLKGRPRLQATGNALTKVRFALKLHWQLGNPDTAFAGLVAAKEAQQAVSLVYGSGRFAGWFVIDSVHSRTLITDAQGRTAAREVDVDLREFVGDPNNPLPTPGIAGGGQNPLLSLLPESVRGTVSEVAAAVQKGVEIYRAAEAEIGRVQRLLYAAKELGSDPAGWLNLLGDAAGIAGSALGRLDGLPQVTALFGSLSGAAEFAVQASAAAHHLGSAAGGIQTALSDGGAFLPDTVLAAADNAAAAMSDGAAAVETLAGWLAVRRDG